MRLLGSLFQSEPKQYAFIVVILKCVAMFQKLWINSSSVVYVKNVYFPFRDSIILEEISCKIENS